MNIMRLVFSNLLLYLALGACFKFTDAQESTETYTFITTTVPNHNSVGEKLSSESTIAGLVNTITVLQTEPDLYHPETTPVYQMHTKLEVTTAMNPVSLTADIEETTAVNPVSHTTDIEETTAVNPVSHTTETRETTESSPADKMEQTTMINTNVETTVAEQITSDAPRTHPYEMTVVFTSSELSSSTEHPDEITTAASAMATDSTEALIPIYITSQPPADWTVSPSDPLETSTVTPTATLILYSQLPEITPEGHSNSTFDDESVSTHVTSVTTGGNIKQSILPIQTSWFLIIIVCVTIICVLCIGIILFVQRRKKNASRTFGPMYVNGQSKRSKKKKGADDDAWAGPVNLVAGAECDAEVQVGLLPDDGKQDGDDMVLSTFATLDEGDMSNGGVGGEGTKEAKKWEEQAPLPYIDEDLDENKAGKTLEENKTQKGDEKSEENGGETFCLTTAV